MRAVIFILGVGERVSEHERAQRARRDRVLPLRGAQTAASAAAGLRQSIVSVAKSAIADSLTAFPLRSYRHPSIIALAQLLRMNSEVLTVYLYLNEVSFQALKDKGFQGVIFDKDNTLTIPHHHEIAAHLQKPLDECRKVFGDRVLIFSNSAGSKDDAGFVKAIEIEEKLQIAVLKHNEKKPGGIEHVKAHFDVAPEKLVMIGDRYSTDVLFGNLHGLLTIRTDQFTHDGESIMNVQLQRIEKAVIRLLLSSGVVPPEHPLLKDGIGDVVTKQ